MLKFSFALSYVGSRRILKCAILIFFCGFHSCVVYQMFLNSLRYYDNIMTPIYGVRGVWSCINFYVRNLCKSICLHGKEN